MLAFLLTITEEKYHAKIIYIYENYHDDMIRLARSRLKQMHDGNYALDAEDVVQDAFVKITKYIDKIDIERPEKEVKTYLFSILVNQAMDFIGQQKNHEDIDAYSDFLSSEEDIFMKLNLQEEYQRVVEAIRKLGEIYQLPLLFYVKHDKKIEEIAALLDLPVNTVKSRIYRGFHQIRMILEKEGA